uniref:Venom dipeptidyl peptidase 4 n=1 Tax=Stomoxys calcitrans TaxID=35570 RepID=A0A1I8PFL3_STOCA
MVEIQKPNSALKRPSLKRETVVVNNTNAPMKKVTLVPKDEAVDFGVDAGAFGRAGRVVDGGAVVNGAAKGYDGASALKRAARGNNDLVFRDPTGGLSILNLENYTTRVLMTNSSFRQLNAESFLVAPDLKYVLLQSDGSAEGSRHHVYEVQTANTFPLGPTENIAEAPRLQYVLWAPYNPLHPANINGNGANGNGHGLDTNNLPPSSTPSAAAGGASQGAPTPTTSILLSSLANGANMAANLVKPPPPIQLQQQQQQLLQQQQLTMQNNRALAQNQAIAFVHENDIYYKPKVQGELVCRITNNGQAGVVYNGIPDWTYENIPELDSRGGSMAFSPDALYLAYLTFNDSEVSEYKYTWMGDDLKYPAVLTQRYPKAGSINPNITVNIVNLSVLKYIFPTQIKLPADLSNGSYIGGLTWATPIDLSVVVTNRGQTKATTVLCRAPDFFCTVANTEVTINDGWVLPNERPIFSKKYNSLLKNANSNVTMGNNENFQNITNGQTTYEITNGGYLLKRLPVRDGEHGHFRHVVFTSSLDRRTVPLTMGRFEVTEIVGWDEDKEIVYFMAAPEKRPGERHLYKISLKLNVTKTNRTYITSSQPTCLTCDNTPSTFRLRNGRPAMEPEDVDEDEVDLVYVIPKNCLYNKVYFSKDFSYYVQECLGPESPSVYLVETQNNLKTLVLNAGDSLRNRLLQYAVPQIRTFNVEIRHGFHAQVKLYLPPGMKEDEEVAFPLILQIDASPGSQLVSERFQVTWNWYLSSQRSYLVAQIDGRGSGFQGELLRTQVHGKLGTVEVEDQLAVLTYLRDTLKFIDPSRICAYGWGYGGYATAMTLIDDSQQVLQCGVAVNPISSFAYHYSFFTERYIPLKGDYLRALQEADLTMKAGNIKGRNLMLIHGTADTLVHQDHTLMLVKALVDQEVKFRHQVYPDEDHLMLKSLSHVYQTMEWYFEESFGPNEDSEWDPTGLFVFKQ